MIKNKLTLIKMKSTINSYFVFCLIISVMTKAESQQWSITETNLGKVRKKTLILVENFETFNFDLWKPDISLPKGEQTSNRGFEIYDNNRSTSFVKNGKLHIQPILTSDKFGEEFLYNGTIDLGGSGPADKCTARKRQGCFKEATPLDIIPPIYSARIRTAGAFSFKYGEMLVKVAKIPSGKWLRPYIALVPENEEYGDWPASGEIDLFNSRHLSPLTLKNTPETWPYLCKSMAFHYGPYPALDAWKENIHCFEPPKVFFQQQGSFGLAWTPERLMVQSNGVDLAVYLPSKEGGFWFLEQFQTLVGPQVENPWRYSTNVRMAPFDQKFHIVIGLSVGGTNGYYPDNIWSGDKPWRDSSPQAMLEFWKDKERWLPTWQNGGSTFIIDQILVESI